MAEQRKLKAPEIWIDAIPYWDACKEGKLLVKKCNACGDAYHYPRPFCPFCMSDDTSWLETSGEGEIYTFSVARRAPIPFALAYVQLKEGPKMLTNIVDCDFDALECGQKVTLAFSPTEGGPPVPVFKPA